MIHQTSNNSVKKQVAQQTKQLIIQQKTIIHKKPMINEKPNAL